MNKQDDKKGKSKSLWSIIFRRTSRYNEMLRGTIRVLVFGSAVCSILGLLSVKSAYGNFQDSALLMGRQLATVGDIDGSVFRVMLNGQSLHLATGKTNRSMKEILDNAQSMCEQQTNGLGHLVDDLPKGALGTGTDKKEVRTALLGISRKEHPEEGMVACLAQQPADDMRMLMQRLGNFANTGDLAEMGELRYMYVRRLSDTSSQVIAAWTKGSFKMFDMFPSISGSDTPGSDSVHAPRPPDSVRLLTTTIEGAVSAVRIYDSARSKKELLAMYDNHMLAKGWVSPAGSSDDMPDGRIFTRDGIEIIVVASEIKGRCYISVTEMLPR